MIHEWNCIVIPWSDISLINQSINHIYVHSLSTPPLIVVVSNVSATRVCNSITSIWCAGLWVWAIGARWREPNYLPAYSLQTSINAWFCALVTLMHGIACKKCDNVSWHRNKSRPFKTNKRKLENFSYEPLPMTQCWSLKLANQWTLLLQPTINPSMTQRNDLCNIYFLMTRQNMIWGVVALQRPW